MEWIAFRRRRPLVNARRNEGAEYGVATAAGWRPCNTGQWEIVEQDGKHWVMDDDEFNRTYERAAWDEGDGGFDTT